MTPPSLRADKIEETIAILQQRIDQRFPERGLSRLCAQLLRVAREDRQRLAWVARPNLWLRGGAGIAIAVGAVGLAMFANSLRQMTVTVEAFNALQGIDAAVNTVVLAGGAAWFLLNLETVWRRRAVLNDLHELRSIAHVVDMHQLTKDPTMVGATRTTAATPGGHNLSAFELGRYLDYCSEMLSLTGKLAALYMQNVRDPVIIEAVNDIEALCIGLSRKIWQKIMILRTMAPDGAVTGGSAAVSK